MLNKGGGRMARKGGAPENLKPSKARKKQKRGAVMAARNPVRFDAEKGMLVRLQN